MFSILHAYRRFDPAAKSLLEIALLYPGIRALFFYRIANWLWRKKLTFAARMTSEFGRFISGIEIHPGATIGKRVIIEHGTGIVIGETTEVGDDVVILQGVTLGSKNVLGATPGKRHPTVSNGVVLCAGAKILGPVQIGAGSVIGANAVVTRDIPANVTAVGAPAKVVEKRPNLRLVRTA